jgi:maltose alpha-D-glucosyltransferase/alpha-amylase
MNLSSVLEGLRDNSTEELARYLVRQRWFRSKARRLIGVTFQDVALMSERPPTLLALVQCQYESGRIDTVDRSHGQQDQQDPEPETYVVPMSASDRKPLVDDAENGRIMLMLTEGIRSGRVWEGTAGSFQCKATARGRSLLAASPHTATPIRGEQSNTSYLLDRRLILKLMRKLEVGTNPEVEMLEFLTGRPGFLHAPKLVGFMEYCRGHLPSTVAVLQEFVPNEGDGWSYALDRLNALTRQIPAGLRQEEAQRFVRERAGDFLLALERLGIVTGQLHLALGSDPDEEAFRPERIGSADVAAWHISMEARIESVFDLVRRHPGPNPSELPLGSYEALEHACRERIAAISLLIRSPVVKIRHHGDYHLGQVLRVPPAAGDFVVVDFEGEPARTLKERCQKACVLKDVAGMLRSFQYAREALVADSSSLSAQQRDVLIAWEDLAGEVFLKGYEETLGTAGQTGMLPPKPIMAPVLDAFRIDKAVYELGYELNNRPAWSHIPLRALQRLCGGSA